jgi:hypothetical protein
LDNCHGGGASLDKFQRRGRQPQALTEPGKQCLALALGLSDQLPRRKSRINGVCRIIDVDKGNLPAKRTGELAADLGCAYGDGLLVDRD